MISPLTSEDYAMLYRFSVTLAGANEEAEHLVHEVLEEKLARFSQSDHQKTLVRLLRALWETRPEPRGDAPISNLPPQFQWMKTHARATATLVGFGCFSDQEITAICGPGEAEETTLPSEKTAAALDSIPVSPELLKRFAVTVQGAHPPFRLFSPLGVALLFAGLVLLTTASWIWRDWHSNADEILAGKFIVAAEQISASKMEPTEALVGELADVLFLKYGLENYPIPPAFAQFSARRIGVSQVDGHPVVQIGLQKSRAWLMLFRAEDFGLGPNDADWQTATQDGWSMAIRSQNQQGHVLTIHGTEEKLRPLLSE